MLAIIDAPQIVRYNMKKSILLLLIAAISVPCAAQTDVDLGSEFGLRLSASINKELTQGLHVYLDEEIRLDNNFGAFDRFHTTIGLTYRLSDYFKVGVGYALINPYSSTRGEFKSSRHRFMLDGTLRFQFGDWRLSLRERLQATYRAGAMNTYQNPRTALALKSRLKLLYKGIRRVEPYAYVELRNTFNEPVINAYFDGTNYLTPSMELKGEPGGFISGRKGMYINRWRGAIGAEYRLSQRSRIDASLLADYVMDKVIDANAEGTKLKSYTYEKGFMGWLSVAYSYSF